MMRKLIIATMIFVLAEISASYARGGMHGGGMHGLGSHALMAPANPTVPPSLTPDARLTGSAPVPPHHQPTAADVSSLPDAMLKPTPEEEEVDRAIGNICRGC
jgi:hypothetical protein